MVNMHPGSSAPGEVALAPLEAAVAQSLPVLLGEVGGLLRVDWPEYARFLDDNVLDVRGAAGDFVHRLVEMTEHRLCNGEPTPLDIDQEQQLVFEHIGRQQWTNGRDLTDLLSAYQVGVRAAWRYVSTIALDQQLPSAVLAALAEAVFAFVDQLSSASARGYVLEQSEAAGERERWRRELSELLLSDRSTSAAVAAAAERAHWTLPTEACVVLVDPADDAARAVIDRLDARCLPIRTHAAYGMIVPGILAGARRTRMVAALRGSAAVVGQSVPLDVLPASVGIVAVGMDLLRRGLIADDPMFVGDHLDSVVVHADPEPIAALRAQVLAPLDPLPPNTRARLVETLASWLRHMGDRTAIAQELFVHPQTVRYRLAQLRRCFGAELDSPRSRARMLLVLEWGGGE